MDSNTELKLRKEIDKVLDDFDFERVHKVMEFLSWKIFIDKKMVLPNNSQLMKQARNRLLEAGEKSLESNESYFSHSGPFKARSYFDKEENKFYLDLMFVVTDGSNWW